MIRSLYALITQKEELTFSYFDEIKEYKLFKPLIEIKKIEPDPSRGIEEYNYTKDMILKMIRFVCHCFTKESPYLKTSDTVSFTKSLVCDDLEIYDEFRERVLKYQIPELEEVIKNYILREEDEKFREWLIARNIYDRNLQAAASAVDEGGNIDIKLQTAYFENAEKFKSKMNQIQQTFESKNPNYVSMVREFENTVRTLHATDYIPK